MAAEQAGFGPVVIYDTDPQQSLGRWFLDRDAGSPKLAKGGIAERSDRLVSILVMTGFAGLLDLPFLREVTLWVLAIASLITVFQRMRIVYKQTVDDPAL